MHPSNGPKNERLYCLQSSGLCRKGWPQTSLEQQEVLVGSVASGSMVIKRGVERDANDQRYGNSILSCEMEVAGLMNNFPCLALRGIYDYCDSHNNSKWRNRAIAVAYAYSKELLPQIEPADVEVLPSIYTKYWMLVCNYSLILLRCHSLRAYQNRSIYFLLVCSFPKQS